MALLTLQHLWHKLSNKFSSYEQQVGAPIPTHGRHAQAGGSHDRQRATTMRHLHAVPAGDDETSQAACWQEFWEVLGKAAYRIWREDQLAALNDTTSEPEGKAA